MDSNGDRNVGAGDGGAAADIPKGQGQPPTDDYLGVREFMAGRSLFITGCTGFVGKVLLEKILRSCPDVASVFVLAREKRGHSLKQRFIDIFNSALFDRVRKEQPEALDKVKFVEGDLLLDGLGISDVDLAKMRHSVSVVIHSAASVRFDEPLRNAVNMNLSGTKRVLELCSTLDKLDVLVHVSTCYANCDHPTVEEKIYPQRYDPEHIMHLVDWLDDEALDALQQKILGDKPNTYTFTKSLAELMIKNYQKNPAMFDDKSTFKSGIIGNKNIEGSKDSNNGDGNNNNNNNSNDDNQNNNDDNNNNNDDSTSNNSNTVGTNTNTSSSDLDGIARGEGKDEVKNEVKDEGKNEVKNDEVKGEDTTSSCCGRRRPFSVAIVRPSIVVASLADPVPGWVDNFNGPSGMIVAAACGFLRSVYSKKSMRADFIPVDIVANTIVVAAWHAGVFRPSTVMVYNCASGNRAPPFTWRDFEVYQHALVETITFDNAVRYPKMSLRDSWLMHRASMVFEHYVPAFIADKAFQLFGKKPQFLRVYDKLTTMQDALTFFTTHQWQFRTEQVERLRLCLNAADRVDFCTDVSALDWNSFIHNYVRGLRDFVLKENHKRPSNWFQRLYIIEQLQKAVVTIALYKAFGVGDMLASAYDSVIGSWLPAP